MPEPTGRPDDLTPPNLLPSGRWVPKPPPAAYRADLAGLLAFLQWMRQHAHLFGWQPLTVKGYLISWRVAHRRLGLARTTAVDDLDVNVLADKLATAGPPGSAQVYRSRLANCRHWHQQWRAAGTDWWHQPDTTVPTAGPRARTVLHRFPLRTSLDLAVELPADLRRDEVVLLHAWLRNLTTDDPTTSS